MWDNTNKGDNEETRVKQTGACFLISSPLMFLLSTQLQPEAPSNPVVCVHVETFLDEGNQRVHQEPSYCMQISPLARTATATTGNNERRRKLSIMSAKLRVILLRPPRAPGWVLATRCRRWKQITRLPDAQLFRVKSKCLFTSTSTESFVFLALE